MNFADLLDDDAKKELGMDEPSLSLETVKPRFFELVSGVDLMVARANGLVVQSDSTLKDATALGVDAKRIAKAVEAKRKEVIAPYSEFVSSVNNFCSQFLERLILNPRKTNNECVEAVLKSKIATYQAQVEFERRQREEAARKAALEVQKKLEAEAAELNRRAAEEARQKALAEAEARGLAEAEAEKLASAAAAEVKPIEAPVVPTPVVPQASGPTRADNGGTAYGSTSWVCIIEDPSLVPREYCVPVQKLLNDAVKQGVRSIPGCVIKEETSVRFRT